MRATNKARPAVAAGAASGVSMPLNWGDGSSTDFKNLNGDGRCFSFTADVLGGPMA